MWEMLLKSEKLARQSTEDNLEPTPLNIQLTKLANLIGKIGFTVAGLAFLIFFVKDVVLYFDFSSLNGWHEWLPVFERTLKYFMMAVTLIVVAVPEGLPMSVTLSLALNMRRMLLPTIWCGKCMLAKQWEPSP